VEHVCHGGTSWQHHIRSIDYCFSDQISAREKYFVSRESKVDAILQVAMDWFSLSLLMFPLPQFCLEVLLPSSLPASFGIELSLPFGQAKPTAPDNLANFKQGNSTKKCHWAAIGQFLWHWTAGSYRNPVGSLRMESTPRKQRKEVTSEYWIEPYFQSSPSLYFSFKWTVITFLLQLVWDALPTWNWNISNRDRVLETLYRCRISTAIV
jgi:hypothetical protein